MINDHTTLLKGSDVHSPKNTYSLNMFEHNTFVFIFRSKTEDNFDGAFPFDSLFEQLFAFINFFLFLVPVKKVPHFGHYMMGLEL